MPVEYRDTDTGSGEPVAIDPGQIAPGAAPAAAGTGTGKKRRGRPPGSGSAAGSAASKAKVALDLSSITGLFVGAHVLLAAKTGTPELAISEDEGKLFMQRAQSVLRHYSVETTQKTMDWISFIGVTVMIYAPRVVAISANRKRGKGATVHHLQPVPQQPAPQQPVNVTGVDHMAQAMQQNMIQPEHEG